MRSPSGSSLFDTLARLPGRLRRPELMIFAPALALFAFWLGGERLMIAAALGLPLLFALGGALRHAPAPGGPPMRREVIAALDRVLRGGAGAGRTTACLVLRFDGAEALHDRHGRAAQAEVIQRSAERICGALRQCDTVAGLEGGGFAIALGPVRRADLESVIQMAVRLQSALDEPVCLDAARVYVSASVGFCLAGRAPEPAGAAMLDAAEIAADEALRNGPGAIRSFSPDMARRRADRDARRAELEAALDRGEIRPHFQPQISADTGEITGFEALARWHHPERGLIPPADFLPAVAGAGLAERLGEVILWHAMTALTRWDAAGLGIPAVGVNFSAEELRNPRLAEKLQWELDRFELAPGRLSVEVLETVATQTENDMIVHNVAALARMGCGIDLDDFGTGHSSLTNLRRFRVRRLKIDRSFVTRVDEDREQQSIVAAILSMAERLELDTLAEGVEAAGEHAMLAQLGCGHVQGFAIARPMPFEETGAWIKAHNARRDEALRLDHRAG